MKVAVVESSSVVPVLVVTGPASVDVEGVPVFVVVAVAEAAEVVEAAEAAPHACGILQRLRSTTRYAPSFAAMYRSRFESCGGGGQARGRGRRGGTLCTEKKLAKLLKAQKGDSGVQTGRRRWRTKVFTVSVKAHRKPLKSAATYLPARHGSLLPR